MDGFEVSEENENVSLLGVNFFSFFRELSARRGHQVRVNHPLGKWDTNGPDFRQDLETYGTSRTQKAGECGDGDEAGCGDTDY